MRTPNRIRSVLTLAAAAMTSLVLATTVPAQTPAVLAAPDVDPPEFVRAVGLPDLVTIIVTFNEPILNIVGSEDPFVWSVLTLDNSEQIALQSVSLTSNMATLKLTSAINPTLDYKVQVEEGVIVDTSWNTMMAPNNFVVLTLAKAIPILNSGFEVPVLAEGEWISDQPNWVEGYYDVSAPGVWVPNPAGGDAGVWNPDAGSGFSGGAAFAGQNTGWTTSYTAFDVGLSQVLGATLRADTEYVLSAQTGNAFYNQSDVTAPYRMELWAGGVLLQSDTGASPAADTWAAHSLTYSSGPNPPQRGQPLEIRLIAVAYADGSGVAGYEVDWDEISLTAITTVPFLITEIVRDPATGNVTLTWNSEPSKDYAIDVSTDLVNWTELVTGVQSQGAETSYTDLFTGGPQPIRFYRLRAL